MALMDEGTSSSSSPNKRLKTVMDDEPDSSFRSPISLVSKGKSKIQEESETLVTIDAKDEESSGDTCGICLSESGTTGVSKGCIDCCDHYFCFLCIMEWAKVESKCPICKRRFSTIRRPAKPNVFVSDRVVQVPVRDQVFDGNGNVSSGPPDPYSEIRCSVCLGQDKEVFLLLCGLCEAAAHTYCVGLDLTVPEGDWFCLDCTALRDERLKSESGHEIECSIRLSSDQNRSSDEDHVSIFDIVRESPNREVRSKRKFLNDSVHLQLPGSAGDGTAEINTVGGASSMSLRTGAQGTANTSTRTLHYRHNLNTRISLMRENWNALQRGTLRFSASAGDGECSGRTSNGSGVAEQPSFSMPHRQLAQCSSSRVKADDKEHEIQKAWKMLDKAKAIPQRCESSSFKHQELLKTKGNGRNMWPRRELIPNNKRRASLNVASSGSGYRNNPSLEGDLHGQSFSFPMGRRFEMSMTRPFLGHAIGSTTAHSRVHVVPESFTVYRSPIDTTCARKIENISKSSVEVPVSSTSLPLDTDNGVPRAPLSCSSVDSHAARKKILERTSLPSQKYDETKNEVRSQVKLYLKLRTKKEKLEVDAFKEIARRATHSILAACGFEDQIPGSYSIPASACSHISNNTSQLQKSSLMPNSCKDCFNSFIKGIVDATLSQKTSL